MSSNNRLMVAIPTAEIREQLARQSSHTAARLRRQATAEYAAAGHVQIDDDALVAVQDEDLELGTVRGWVAAWVFVEVPLVKPRPGKVYPDLCDLKNWEGIPADRGRTLYRFGAPTGTYLLTPLFLDDGRFHGYNVSFEGRKIGRATDPAYGALVAWEHQQEALKRA